MSWEQQTLSLRQKKKKSWLGIQYVWALLLRPCESHEQSIFSWQIMFTSKFKNTHPHLEEMPSHFLCDLSGHICGQYCLACGQPSFYCFISASLCRNNGGGPLAASAHMHTRECMQPLRYAYNVYTRKYALYGRVRTSVHTCSLHVAAHTTHTHTAWSNNI